MFNGTSMAAPQAAGAGALLVSAAKQAGVQYQPAQIRQAQRRRVDPVLDLPLRGRSADRIGHAGAREGGEQENAEDHEEMVARDRGVRS